MWIMLRFIRSREAWTKSWSYSVVVLLYSRLYSYVAMWPARQNHIFDRFSIVLAEASPHYDNSVARHNPFKLRKFFTAQKESKTNTSVYQIDRVKTSFACPLRSSNAIASSGRQNSTVNFIIFYSKSSSSCDGRAYHKYIQTARTGLIRF